MEVKVMAEHDGVQVINIINLMEFLFGEDAFKWNGPSYNERSAAVRKWVEENDAHYYADVKEDFFIHRGVNDAIDEGKKIVVVENLS